jgi:phosphoribosylformylglycinamidine synthase
MNWEVEIKTMLKKSILDPQGQAVEKGLDSLSYKNVSDVKVGKHMELVIEDVEDKEEVESQIEEMCERLLANPVIEDYTFQVKEMEG